MAFSRVKALWRNWLHKQRVDDELDTEVRAYVDEITAEKIAAGIAPAEARRLALIEFGGVEQVKEEVRGVRAGALLEQFWQDVRYGIRVLAKNPGFTLVAVLTLALGIGVNASIFTLFDSVALRPLQLPESNRLVDVYQTIRGKVSRNVMGGMNLLSYPEYLEYSRDNEVFSAVAAYKPEMRATLGANLQEVNGQLTTCNYFDVLQVRPALGRGFTSSECAAANSGPVVVISDDLWKNTFHSDPAIVGKVVRLNRVPLTVIGVAGPDFHGTQIIPAQFWSPVSMAPSLVKWFTKQDLLTADDLSWIAMIARLKNGVSVADARANLAVVAARIDQRNPGRQTEPSVTIATMFGRPDMRTVAFGVGSVVLAAVMLVLLIACANIANLMLARAANRTREIAVRLAMGASRARLVRQLLTESLLIALIGGTVGLLASVWSEPALVRVVLSRIPANGPWFTISRTPDVRVLLYAFGLTVMTGIAFGLIPALHATRSDVNCALKDEGAQTTQNSRGRLRGLLVGTQVAVCLVLLISAGLLLRGLYRAQNIDPGFDMSHLGQVGYSLRQAGYSDERAAAFNQSLIDRLRAMPGVQDAAIASAAPLADMHEVSHFSHPGRHDGRAIEFNLVGEHFFSVVGVPITRGRDFTETEVRSGANVMVVSESAARMLWPGEDPIDKQLTRGTGATLQVIGVAKDVEIAEPGNEHLPYLFLPAGPKDQIEISSVVLRTRPDFHELSATMRTAAQELDPELKVEATPVRDNMQEWVVPSQICATLAGTLGLLGLLLASIGIYGTAAYSVSRRVREIGIRMALGARAQDVKALVLRQSMRPVLIGGAVGILLCAAVTRILAKLLFGISPLDSIAFTLVPAFLALVALLASYLPARKAVRVDPMVALRHE